MRVPSDRLCAATFVLLLSLCGGLAADTPRVGIIGAGIGGASCAYYTSKLVPSADITIFEARDYIGGRLKHITMLGSTLNVGGDAWASENYYLIDLVSELNIPLSDDDDDGNGHTGIWGGPGQGWVHTMPSSISQFFKDLPSALRVFEEVEEFKLAIWLNYAERYLKGPTKPFTTVEEFLGPAGLNVYANQSLAEYFFSHGVDMELAETYLLPITRTIYDQYFSLNTFAGLTSLLPLFSDNFSAKGGNDVMVEAIVNASRAAVMLSTHIDTVEYVAEGAQPFYRLYTSGGDSVDVDMLVLAAPFEFANMTLVNVPLAEPIETRPYVHWYVTMVTAAGLNPYYFGGTPYGEAEVPDVVFTAGDAADTAPFVVIQIQTNNSYEKVYKIFSNDDVSDVLTDIFDGVSVFYVQHWNYTFPVLDPAREYQPVVLAENFFYTSTLESVAVAMECSVIGGRNAAELIAESIAKRMQR